MFRSAQRSTVARIVGVARDGQTPRHGQPNHFAIPFGPAGLAGTWLALADAGDVSPAIGEALLGISVLLWLTIGGGYVRKAIRHPAVIRSHLSDPVMSPFTALIVITPVLVSAEGVFRLAPSVGRDLVDVFVGLVLVLGGYLTAEWMMSTLTIDQIHPGDFLPTVAGGLLASLSASTVGQPGLGYALLGLGSICWIILVSIIMGRLVVRPLLPKPLIPTMAIEVAPAASPDSPGSR